MSETGLPELPEGYLWRVRYHRTPLESYYGRRYYTDKKRLQVQLIRTYVQTEAVTERKWFRTVTTYEEATREAEVLTEDAQGTNPIAIRNAANRIMNLWARQKERDDLVGDYPPKKLEVA